MPATTASAMLSTLPLDDWQFWVASVIAVGALVLVASPLIPRRKKQRTACRGCPTGDSSKEAKPKHVDLTIGGRRVRP